MQTWKERGEYRRDRPDNVPEIEPDAPVFISDYIRLLLTGPIPPVFEADKKDIPDIEEDKTIVCHDFLQILA